MSAVIHDLFISYAEADRAWVEGYLLDALTQAGVACHTEAAFALGAPRLLEFERAVQESRRTLLVLSPAYLADHLAGFADLLAQSYGLDTATWPVIPLILRSTRLPPRLAMLSALDATDDSTWPTIVARLLDELQHPFPEPQTPPPCPYPGMAAFGEEDSGRFYGRQAETQQLVEQLRLHPFVAVIGRSGTGKSSLVFAGLVPALKRSRLFGAGGWQVLSVRPGAAPLVALRSTLAGILDWDAFILSDRASNRLLLVVDQFEELFTLSGADALPFQEALLRLSRAPGCFVVLTVRADFYPDLMVSPLWREIQAHRFEVLPLAADALRQAITQPAEDVGVYVEAALVERLMADAGSEPGILPFVQETLVLLWERIERRYLPLRAYEALVLPGKAYGEPPRTGLQVAMALRADAAMAELAEGDRAVARRIFLRLVQFGEGRADTRRQQPVAALRAADDAPDRFEHVLRHLANRRLLTLGGGEGEAERSADIAHEALIDGWAQLRRWITERREAELTRRRLEAKAAEWVRLGRESGLLDEVELLEAERWLSSSDAAALGHDETLLQVTQASRAAIVEAERQKEAVRQRQLQLERRAKRRAQMLAAVLGVLAAVSLGIVLRLEVLRYLAARGAELVGLPQAEVAYERFEVTNRRYAYCVQAGRCIVPPPGLSTFHDRASVSRPVTGLDVLQAAAFCDWIGRRLPSFAEWAAAAHQDNAPPWPLSEGDKVYDYANLQPDGPPDPKRLPEPVGSRRPTVEGIYDLVGNVAEWTSTPWRGAGPGEGAWDMTPADVPDRLTTVGGSYRTTVNSFYPVETSSSFRYNTLGFRCIEDRR